MKAGRVVRMRVSPKDAMAVADVCKAHAMPAMGFSQSVSYTLAVLLETARTAGMIPERDGFEYNELMQQFLPSTQGQGRKLAITKQVELAGSSFGVNGLRQPVQPEQQSSLPSVPVSNRVDAPVTPRPTEAGKRLAGLQREWASDMTGAARERWEKEWLALFPVVYPGEPIRLPNGERYVDVSS